MVGIIMNSWNTSAHVYAQHTTQIRLYTVAAGNLVRLSQVEPSSEVADVGCGSTLAIARSLLELDKRPKSILNIDSSPHMIDIAKSIEIPGISCRFEVLSGEKLGLVHTNQFGSVFCNAAFWNLAIERGARSIAMALRTGGEYLFSISEWDLVTGRQIDTSKYEAINQVLHARKLPPKPSFGSREKLTFAQIKNVMCRNGLRLRVCESQDICISSEEYRHLYQVPAIAQRSLPHISEQEALDVLARAIDNLGPTWQHTVQWSYFVFSKEHSVN
ncbi:MAG: hypothetical protein ETSY2_03195 [Candidatus Entotheonella gemina]|uniref:Methyltransferase type 11 domain-containing protein n=1 Tax=Candidatus Entotheonella gemina TaxID=1429439 RepID=W4MFZ1_9BACT|nr:MAG: hypothetical protein ETSY2_03195 [Candidatus Entotheonella gemina]